MLTILGIVIGITTVVTVASLLTGLRAGVVTFFDELGPDNVFVFKSSGDPSQSSRHPRSASAAPSSRNTPTTSGAMPPVAATSVWRCSFRRRRERHIRSPRKVPGFETDTIPSSGVSPNMDRHLRRADFDSGPLLHDEENHRGAHVAVLGFDLAEALFPDGNAVGRTFMLDGAEFTVIGVFCQGQGRLLRREQRRTPQIDMPLKTAESRYPQVDRFMITAKAKPGMRKDAFDEVEGIMRRIRHLHTDAEDDFSISTPDQIIQQFDKITGLIGLVAIAISGAGPAGGRHRRDEHHAGERHRAHPRNRRAQSAGRAGASTSSASFWWKP